MTTLAEFDALLARIDWHYQRSDDPTVYRRGAESTAALGPIERESPEHLSLIRAWRDCAYSELPRPDARAVRDRARREVMAAALELGPTTLEPG